MTRDPLTLTFNAVFLQALETGAGYAVMNPQGAFFCGFESADGKLVFSNFEQSGNGVVSATRKAQAKETGAPVFLTVNEMQEKGVSAAVYMVAYRDGVHSDFAPEVFRGCKAVSVIKDVTNALNNSKLDKMGLASPTACTQGVDAGYYNLSDSLRAFAGTVRKAVGKLLP